MYYGWRGKIGLISPATSPSIESDFNHFAPEGVHTDHQDLTGKGG